MNSKHVLIKDVETEEYPVFKASAEVEEAARQALKEIDKAIANDFLSNYT